jgi:hypothetical protein
MDTTGQIDPQANVHRRMFGGGVATRAKHLVHKFHGSNPKDPTKHRLDGCHGSDDAFPRMPVAASWKSATKRTYQQVPSIAASMIVACTLLLERQDTTGPLTGNFEAITVYEAWMFYALPFSYVFSSYRDPAIVDGRRSNCENYNNKSNDKQRSNNNNNARVVMGRNEIMVSSF